MDADALTASLEAGGATRPLPADGDPVDPEWRLYARSASDDKAPIGALLPVLAALREAGIAPTSNLRFFFEGEEEAGSPNLAAISRPTAPSSTRWTAGSSSTARCTPSGRPQLTFGVRGVTGLELTVYGPAALAAQRALRQLGAGARAAARRSCSPA